MLTFTFPRLLVAAVAITTLGSLQAQSPEAAQGMAQMGQQLAKFGGTMHATAKVCGGYTEAELNTMKEQQQEQLAQMGMSAEDFKQAFAGGEKEGATKWKTVPKAKQAAACEEFKQHMTESMKGLGG